MWSQLWDVGTGDRGQDPFVPSAPSFASWINNFPPAPCHQCHEKQGGGRQSPALSEGGIRIYFEGRHADIIITGKTRQRGWIGIKGTVNQSHKLPKFQNKGNIVQINGYGYGMIRE